jgi:hypothetical protein
MDFFSAQPALRTVKTDSKKKVLVFIILLRYWRKGTPFQATFQAKDRKSFSFCLQGRGFFRNFAIDFD